MNEVYETRRQIIEQVRGPAFVQVPDAIVLTTGYQTTTQTLIASCGDFLWTRASMVATGDFHFKIYSEEDTEELSNDKVRAEHFWAKGGAWQEIPPKFIGAGKALRIWVEDRSNSANTIRLYLDGFQILDGRKVAIAQAAYGRGRGLRILTTPAASADGTTIRGGTTITASSTGQRSVIVDPTYHLRIGAIAADATSDSWRGTFKYVDPRLATSNPFSVKRIDSKSWTGRAPTLAAAASTRGLYYPEGSPIFRAGTNVDLDLEDYSASTNYAHHSFIGERVSDEEALA